MKKNNSNKKNPTEPTSTQSNESRKFGMLLDNSTSSNTEEADVENFDWVKLDRSPFYAVGNTGSYSIVLAGQVIHPEKFKTIKAAQKAVDEKGWDLILLATSVYRDAWEFQNRKK